MLRMAPADRLSPFQAPPQLATFTGRLEEAVNLSRYLCSRAERRVGCLLGMAAGGVLFTIGVVFLKLDRRYRFFHAAWHICVIAASACCLSVSLLLLVPTARVGGSRGALSPWN